MAKTSQSAAHNCAQKRGSPPPRKESQIDIPTLWGGVIHGICLWQQRTEDAPASFIHPIVDYWVYI